MTEIARPGRPAAWQWVGRAVVGPLRVKVHGAERLPAAGPALVVANHLTLADGPIIYSHARRGMHVLVKREAFTGPLGVVLRASGQIPIDRSSADRTALDTALKVLERGDAVAIFPEGTRGGGLAAEVRSGAAWLAMQSGAPVVPVAVLGTRRSARESRTGPPPLRRIDVVFGAPVVIADEVTGTGRARRLAASELLRTTLADHILAAVDLTGQSLPREELEVAVEEGSAAGEIPTAPHLPTRRGEP